MGGITKENKERRRRQVYLLFEKGLSEVEIAEKLGHHVRTIHCDLKHFREQEDKLANDKKYLAKKQLHLILNIEEELENIKEEYWKVYNKLKKEDNLSLRIRILRSITDRIDKEIKILIKLLDPFLNSGAGVNDYVSAKDIKKIMDTVSEIIEKFVPPNLRTKAIEIMANLDIGEKNIIGEENE